MPLREEMESAGNRLFQWRSYLPLAMLGVLAAGMRGFGYPGGRIEAYRAWSLLCFALSLAGLGLRACAVGHAPARTSGKNTRGQVADVINRTGLYSLVRHPLYLGNFVITMGIAMFTRSAWVALTTALLFIVYYERIMFAEEEFLRRRFGAEYEQWALRTPAFLPRLGGWTPPALPFSLKSTVKREYGAFFAVAAVFAFLDLLAGLVVTGGFRMDPVWQGVAGASAVFYAAVRILRRYTGILDAPGR